MYTVRSIYSQHSRSMKFKSKYFFDIGMAVAAAGINWIVYVRVRI
jgi:hypothetical protein